MTEHVQWQGEATQAGIDFLEQDGKMIVSPTKVGYIIMTTDKAGLERKFDAKQRNRNKPGVVLCGSMEQLEELAEMTPKIRDLYQTHWDQDVLFRLHSSLEAGSPRKIPWRRPGRVNDRPAGNLLLCHSLQDA